MEPSGVHPLLNQKKIFLSAGVFDVLSAKIAEKAGFETVVLSGYATAASYLGEPDFGLLTQTEILDVARRICRAVNIRVIVDGDTGYGSALNVIRMVEELLHMGAGGIILEDQTWPKRCGHMRGKSVIPMEEHVKKIRAAKDAKGDRDFLIVGRTDARTSLGLDEAIKRGRAYREAGADLIFVEATETKEEMRRIVEEVQGLLVINMIEGGQTPLLSLQELADMGYVSVGYVLSGLFAAAKAMDQIYRYLLKQGTSLGQEDKMMPFDTFTEIVGLEEKFALDEKYRSEK
jgi:methylisocitrate lyase